MADTNKITKIYDLRTSGYDDAIQKLNAINQAFIEIRKNKVNLNNQKARTEDPAELERISKLLQEQKIRTAELRLEKEKLTNDTRAAAIIRQQEINQQKAKIEGNAVEAGSYTALVRAQKELYALIKPANAGSIISFKGDLLSFDQAKQKYAELAAAEQAFRRQFTQDKTLVGEYTTGIVQAFKKMGLDDLIGGQVTKAAARLKDLDASFDAIKQDLSEMKVNGAGGFEALEKQLIENRKEAIELNKQVTFLKTELRGAGDIGNQITNSIAQGFKNAKGQIAQLVLSYVGFQAAFQGILSGVDTAKELADQTSNLEVELEKSAGGARALVDQLAKLDTRTKLTVLEDIANIAAKAGVSEQNLLGVTQALDKIKIAFGKDFGDIETGTESLVKLVNIFEGADQVTGDNLLKTGNAVRTLANESVASVPFLNDFARRMAGLKAISDITLPAVLGLASGFETFGQTAEVSSTALVKIIPKLATDTEKYGKVAGLTQQAFSDLLKNNPAEALIRVSEGLVKSKSGIEEISAAFADSELGSGRIATVLATVGGNADSFRKSIASAGKSFQDTGNIETAFAAKNTNLAATLDKISKSFADAANSRGFQLALTAIAGIITFVISNLAGLSILLGVLAIAWAANNQQMLLARGQLLLYNAGILLQRIALIGLTIAQGAYNAMIALYTGVTTGATVATRLLGLAMRALPIGIILTLLGILVATFRAFGSAVAGTTAELRHHAIQQQLTADISKRVADATTDLVSKTQSYIQVLKAEGVSLETKKKVLADLIAQAPEYLSGLTLANVATQKGINIIDNYIAALRSKAAEEAAQAIRSEKLKKDIQLSLIQQKLETKIATGKRTDLGDLTDEEKEFVSSARKNFAFTASVTDLVTGSSAAKEALAAIQDQRGQIAIELDETDALIKRKYTDIGKAAVGAGASSSTAAEKQVEIDIAALKTKLDDLDKQIDAFKGSQAELNKIVAERSKTQDALDKALGSQKTGGSFKGSRLTGDQRDAFKDIDALRDEQLASAKLTRQELNKEFGFRAQDEINYLEQIRLINETAINKKLALIKGKNAEERKIVAELKLDRITTEITTNEQIFQIREKALQEEFDRQKKAAETTAADIVNDPTAKDFQRAQARLDANTRIIAAQEKFDAGMDALEKQFGLKSKKNAEDRLQAEKDLGIKQKNLILDNTKAGIEQQLKDTEDAALNAINEIKQRLADQTVDILGDDSLSANQKAAKINELQKEATTGILNNEVAKAIIQLKLYKKQLDEKIISQQQYNEKVKDLYEAEVAAAQDAANKSQNALTKTASYFKEAIANLTGFFKGVKAAQSDINDALDAAAAHVQDAISQAFQSFFASEQRKVDQSRELAQKRLDIEQEQVTSKAQSEAEKASIERQFKLKAEAADKEAAEKRKKIAIKQMAIEFGLAALKTLAEYPFPYSLIPLGALTLAYAVKLADVKNQTFEQGGEVPTRGGKFGGRPHSQGGTGFTFKDRAFEAEVDELAVIRTKNANKSQRLSISGTHAQIASALNSFGGGINFLPGAKLRKLEYGGNLGESLQPPMFTPSVVAVGSNNSAGNKELLEGLLDVSNKMSRQTDAINDRIDRLEVYQVTDTVTNAQRKKVRQSNVGTL